MKFNARREARKLNQNGLQLLDWTRVRADGGFVRTTELMCHLPDDPLDVAAAFVGDKARDAAFKLRAAVIILDASARAHEIGIGMRTIQREVAAMNTRYFEATHEKASQVREAAEGLTHGATRAAQRAKWAIRFSLWVVRGSPWLFRGVRTLLLAAAAAAGLLVGFATNSFGTGTQIALAAVVFAVLDLVVVDLFLERWLKDFRRWLLRSNSKSVERRFGRAEYLLKTAQEVVDELPEPGHSAP